MKHQTLTRHKRCHSLGTERQRGSVARELLGKAELILQVEQRLQEPNSGAASDDLADRIIAEWLGCPRFASLMVDRLMLATEIRNHKS